MKVPLSFSPSTNRRRKANGSCFTGRVPLSAGQWRRRPPDFLGQIVRESDTVFRIIAEQAPCQVHNLPKPCLSRHYSVEGCFVLANKGTSNGRYWNRQRWREVGSARAGRARSS